MASLGAITRKTQGGTSLLGVVIGVALLGFLIAAVSIAISQSIEIFRKTRIQGAFQEIDPLLRGTALRNALQALGSPPTCSGFSERLRDGWQTVSPPRMILAPVSGWTPIMPAAMKDPCSTGGVALASMRNVFCLEFKGDQNSPGPAARLQIFALVAMENWDLIANKAVSCPQLLSSPGKALRMVHTLFWRPRNRPNDTFQSQNGAAYLPLTQ